MVPCRLYKRNAEHDWKMLYFFGQSCLGALLLKGEHDVGVAECTFNQSAMHATASLYLGQSPKNGGAWQIAHLYTA